MFYKILLLASGLLIFYNSYVFSEDQKTDTAQVYQVPSITVTTTRAITGKSPVPFNELTKADINNSYTVQDMPQLLSNLPSVIFSSQNGNGIGYSDLVMRGFDQRRISVLINGIPQNDPEDHDVYWIDFPDLASNLDNIQVQRGAGMINYGAAAIGGSINLTTSNYVDRKGVKVFSGLGMQQYNSGINPIFQATENKYSIEVSSGLIDNFAVYGRLSNISSAGYRDNSWTNLNSYFLSAVRFDEKFTTQINIFGGPISDGLSYNGLPKSYINDPVKRRLNLSYFAYDSTYQNVLYPTLRRKQELENFSQPHYELLNDWYINDNLTLKSALFYYTGDGFFDYDGSWATAGMLRLTPEFGWQDSLAPQNTIIRAYVGIKQGGWIPRLIWKVDKSELTLGTEIRFHRSEHWSKIQYAENLPVGYDPDYKFYSYNGERNIFSVFGRENYHLNEQLTLNAELQYVYQSYAITNEKAGYKFTQYLNTDNQVVGNGGKLFNVVYQFLNPRIGVNYLLEKDISFYASMALTSREPRMINLYYADNASFGGSLPLFEADTLPNGTKRFNFSKPLAKPERMLDMEIGWNYRTDKYLVSIDGYWMEYTDELIKSGQLNIFGEPIDNNAPKTRHMGIELQAGYNLFNNSEGKLDISANATISKNKIIEDDYYTSSGKVISLTNNPIAGFPDNLANLNISYNYKGLFVELNAKFVGSFRTDNFGEILGTNPELAAEQGYNDNKVESYNIFNATAAYTFKKVLSLNSIKLQAQCFNLLNKFYASSGSGKEFFPGAERIIFVGIELGI